MESAPPRAGLAGQCLCVGQVAQPDSGRFLTRRIASLVCHGLPSVEDCWGRALWGLGAAVSGHGAPREHDSALTAFERGADWRSPHPRAMAFAALGAAEILDILPDHCGARDLIAAAAQMIGDPECADGWLWPEPRLTYANAVLPEVLVAAGTVLDEPELVERGLRLLGWLLDVQTRAAHPSVVPVRGRGRPGPVPGFDQQPVEVPALAAARGPASPVPAAHRCARGGQGHGWLPVPPAGSKVR